MPETLIPAIQFVGGVVLCILGISFAYKAYKAIIHGRLEYWSGLEHYGMLFLPVTILSPFAVHVPANEKTLIKPRQETYVHMFYGPLFFLASLMFVTAGCDFMGLPGAQSLNTLLTFGRNDLPAAIRYHPPFRYDFPILRKAAKTIHGALITKIPQDRRKSLNAFERNGVDVENKTLGGGNNNDK